MTDPLQSLVVDEETLAREELGKALAGYLQLTKEGRIWLLPAFEGLASEHKVLCLLLALKALHLLGLRETDSATPAELVDLSGMAPGTVRPKLAALLKSRAADKAGSRYSLPAPAARRAITLLSTEGK